MDAISLRVVDFEAIDRIRRTLRFLSEHLPESDRASVFWFYSRYLASGWVPDSAIVKALIATGNLSLVTEYNLQVFSRQQSRRAA